MVTIGIGDRGNELGLGKIREKVEKIMKNGAVLGCSVASDYVIMAGVSNWGGYAISVGLYIVTLEYYVRNKYFYFVSQNIFFLEWISVKSYDCDFDDVITRKTIV